MSNNCLCPWHTRAASGGQSAQQLQPHSVRRDHNQFFVKTRATRQSGESRSATRQEPTTARMLWHGLFPASRLQIYHVETGSRTCLSSKDGISQQYETFTCWLSFIFNKNQLRVWRSPCLSLFTSATHELHGANACRRQRALCISKCPLLFVRKLFLTTDSTCIAGVLETFTVIDAVLQKSS